MKKLFLVLIVILFVPTLVFAQAPVVVNPTTLEFIPSLDHDAVNALDNTPVLSTYEARFYPEAGGAMVGSMNIGKPTPVNGKITITSLPVLTTLPRNVRLICKVAAIGPDGVNESAASNPFGMRDVKIPVAPTIIVIKK